MATPTLARIPTTSSFARALNTSKPILKNPAPPSLALSPLPFSPSFSPVFITPSVTSPDKSPHVHFVSSPCLVSTFTTHSPNTYDRAPSFVSPNPLALPILGDGVYSPTIDGFKTAETPNHVSQPKSLRLNNNNDPRSPPPSKVQTRNEIHLGEFLKKSAQIPTELSKALTTYPRSPYATAPASPVGFSISEDYALRDKPANRRAFSFDEKKLKLGRKGYSPRTGGRSSFTVTPLLLGKSNLSPIKEDAQIKVKSSNKPPPLDLEPSDDLVWNTDIVTTVCSSGINSAQLYQAFWESMSFEGTLPQGSAEATMTSLERANGLDVDVPP